MSEPIFINNTPVHPKMFEAHPLERCRVEECQAYCCTGGVYISVAQVQDIRAHAALIQPHLPPERQDPALWFDDRIEDDPDNPGYSPVMGTQVLPDPTHRAGQSCAFLRPDRKCALQVAGVAAGEHPWRFKPFYCRLFPLEFTNGVLGLAEENEMYQDGGSCQRPATEPRPLCMTFDVELQLVLGEAGYAEVLRRVQAP